MPLSICHRVSQYIVSPSLFLQKCITTFTIICRSQDGTSRLLEWLKLPSAIFLSLLSLQHQMGPTYKTRVMDESVWTAGRMVIDRWNPKCLQNNLSLWTSTTLHRMSRHSIPGLHVKKSKTNRMNYGREKSLNGTKPSLTNLNFSVFEKRN